MRKEAENMQLSITDRKARLGNDYDDKLDNELKKILNNFSKAMESKSKELTKLRQDIDILHSDIALKRGESDDLILKKGTASALKEQLALETAKYCVVANEVRNYLNRGNAHEMTDSMPYSNNSSDPFTQPRGIEGMDGSANIVSFDPQTGMAFLLSLLSNPNPNPTISTYDSRTINLTLALTRSTSTHHQTTKPPTRYSIDFIEELS
jgi:hypothetical protein